MIVSLANKYHGNDTYGFRKQNGTRETILGLGILIEKNDYKIKYLTYLSFIDIKNIFKQLFGKLCFQ